MIVYDARQRPVELGEVVGRGGEAVVYHVANQPERLAKIYEPEPRPNYTGKLEWMVNHPPDNPTQHLNHASLAWPGGLLYDSRRSLKGYWMPFIRDAVPVLEVFNPRRRAEKLPQFDRRYLLRTARNLAAALSALQRSGYVAGDLNESNVLVTPAALVTIIDTDSFQVREERGDHPIIYACPVGKPEYTPPELQHKPLSEVVRRPDHDAFGLAVLIFQLLMDGSHPFRAQWLAAGDPPPLEIRIANGAYPYIDRPAYPVLPPKNAPGIETLHPSLQELFRRCFVEGHRDPRWRPGPDLWVRALTDAERALVLCSQGHYYSSHLESCPYCALAQQRRQAPRQAVSPPRGKESAPTGRARARWTPPPFAQARPAQAGASVSGTGSIGGSRSGQPGLGGATFRPVSPLLNRVISSWLGGSAAPARATGSFGFPRYGSTGVLRSRPPLTRADFWRWARAWIYKSLTTGGRIGALAGVMLGGAVGLVNWLMGEPLLWSLIFYAGGTAGGLLRGWKPGHKLASVIDRFVGWKLFWEAVGFLVGSVLGGLLGLMFVWAVIPVILGLVMGAQLGVLVGRKLWGAGQVLGWERIWGAFSALSFGLLGTGIAHLAGLLAMNQIGGNLVSGLLPFAANGDFWWAGIWMMAGGAGGALSGALSGLITDLLGRLFRLVD